jgi:hypothetical protein
MQGGGSEEGREVEERDGDAAPPCRSQISGGSRFTVADLRLAGVGARHRAVQAFSKRATNAGSRTAVRGPALSAPSAWGPVGRAPLAA